MVEPITTASGSPSILTKAFDILDTLDQDGRRLTLSQISRRCGLPKSTAHRVIRMLIELDAVQRDGESYRIGPTMFTLGNRFSRVWLRDVARPFLQALATRTGQGVQFALVQDGGVLVLESLGTGPARLRVSAGDRLEPHRCTLGRTLLACSPTEADDAASLPLRVRRYGLPSEGAVGGVGCVAVPVLSKSRLLGVVSVTYPRGTWSAHHFVGALQNTAARIARAAEHTRPLSSAG